MSLFNTTSSQLPLFPPSSTFSTESMISRETTWRGFSCMSAEASPAPWENYASHDATCRPFPAEDLSELNANRWRPESSLELRERGWPVGETHEQSEGRKAGRKEGRMEGRKVDRYHTWMCFSGGVGGRAVRWWGSFVLASSFSFKLSFSYWNIRQQWVLVCLVIHLLW